MAILRRPATSRPSLSSSQTTGGGPETSGNTGVTGDLSFSPFRFLMRLSVFSGAVDSLAAGEAAGADLRPKKLTTEDGVFATDGSGPAGSRPFGLNSCQMPAKVEGPFS